MEENVGEVSEARREGGVWGGDESASTSFDGRGRGTIADVKRAWRAV